MIQVNLLKVLDFTVIETVAVSQLEFWIRWFIARGEVSVLCVVVTISIGFSIQEITSTGVRKGEVYLADVTTKLKNKNITTDVKVDTNSNVSRNFLLR